MLYQAIYQKFIECIFFIVSFQNIRRIASYCSLLRQARGTSDLFQPQRECIFKRADQWWPLFYKTSHLNEPSAKQTWGTLVSIAYLRNGSNQQRILHKVMIILSHWQKLQIIISFLRLEWFFFFLNLTSSSPNHACQVRFILAMRFWMSRFFNVVNVFGGGDVMVEFFYIFFILEMFHFIEEWINVSEKLNFMKMLSSLLLYYLLWGHFS